MSPSRSASRGGRWAVIPILVLAVPTLQAQESPYLYGIHDHDPSPQEWLNHLNSGGVTGWVTATVAIGHNRYDYGGLDFRSISNQGHTVICRLNNGYGDDGTIPVSSEYGNFAARCANFVAASQGCNHYIIGNETNLASEWPKVGGWRSYISPQGYANCFRLCYDAIKAVAPGANVLSEALAPFGGPYGAGADHDGNPLDWTVYMNQMLTAIDASGNGPDGIAAHITSRGYTYADVHSTAKVNGQYWSFYVYKDWVNLGTPASMRTLPYYATECNGYYYWKGGHAECTDPNNPSCSYQQDWIEWIYEEINTWNQAHMTSGQGIYHCVNMYRWCSWCDGWNIDGSSKESQILTDLDDAATHEYRWDGGSSGFTDDCPTGTNLSLTAGQVQTDSVYGPDWGGDKAIDGIVSAQSKWTSAGTVPPHWLALDLGESLTVNGFRVVMPGATPEGTQYNAQAFSIQSANSISGPWITEVTIDNSAQASIVCRSYVTPRALRYVRLYITDAGIDNYARIPEFEVWGVAGEDSLIANGRFGAGLTGWNTWIQRNTGGDFSASVVSGELRETGSNYNAGVWQQFSTGGAGTYIDIAGIWRTNPTVANYQWGEVIIINSGRTPVNGVDEGTQADDEVIYRNDTWASQSGWNGSMADTAAVVKVGKFIAAGGTATILLKSGNDGGTSSGVAFDDIIVTAFLPQGYTGDFDDDGDVDQDDFAFLQTCLSGMGVNQTDEVCAPAKLDGDEDVDRDDLAIFQACCNGANLTPPIQCVN